MRVELVNLGVTVTALLPGPTNTDFFHRADMDDTKADQSAKDDPAEVARDGYEALMAGDDHVIAGSVKNQLQVIGGRLMSLERQAKIHAKQVRPGSANG